MSRSKASCKRQTNPSPDHYDANTGNSKLSSRTRSNYHLEAKIILIASLTASMNGAYAATYAISGQMNIHRGWIEQVKRYICTLE